MKKSIKIFSLLLMAVAFSLTVNSCRSHGKMCKGMKYYKQDLKRGLAH